MSKKYIAVIVNNETGETRQSKQKAYDNDIDIESLEYMWGEGNWSCDCNRHLEFERVKKRYYNPDDIDCGDVKYSVPHLIVDGENIQIDDSKVGAVG